jgi:hypothetical protein
MLRNALISDIKETDEAPEMDKCLSAFEQIGD